jgi:hypothetical protein
VFTQVSDPVGQGFVSNPAHPGGNLTGFTSFEFSIGTKWLEALKQTAPHGRTHQHYQNMRVMRHVNWYSVSEASQTSCPTGQGGLSDTLSSRA